MLQPDTVLVHVRARLVSRLVDHRRARALLTIVTFLLGENYSELALSSITGPCYLAVTNDSIALGRWFDAQSGDAQRE